MNSLFKQNKISFYVTKSKVISFKSQHRLIEGFLPWVYLDRSMTAIVVTAMMAGMYFKRGPLLLPYLIWVPLGTTVNFFFALFLVNTTEKTCIVIGLVICSDLYGFGVVYSSRQHMLLAEMMTAKYRKYKGTTFDRGYPYPR